MYIVVRVSFWIVLAKFTRGLWGYSIMGIKTGNIWKTNII